MHLHAIPARRIGGSSNGSQNSTSNAPSRRVRMHNYAEAASPDIPPIMNTYKWNFLVSRLSQTFLLNFLGLFYFPLFFCIIAGREVIWIVGQNERNNSAYGEAPIIQQWWFHVVYVVITSILLTVLSVFLFSFARYSLKLLMRHQRRRQRKRRIRPAPKSKAPNEGDASEVHNDASRSADIDAQLAELLGDVEDSSDDEDDMEPHAAQEDDSGEHRKHKTNYLKKWRKRMRKSLTLDKLYMLVGQHHGFTRDFLLRILCAVVLFAGMIFSLAPYRVRQGFVDNAIVAWIYSVIMTLIFAHGSFSLIAKDAPELSQYMSFDWWNPFYRVFYLLLFLCVDAIAAISGGVSTARGGTGDETPQLVLWNRVTHAAALLIPAGIASGFLPQPNVFLSWAFEFMQVYFHGGTPASSNARLLILTCLSWLSTLAVFMSYYFGSASIGVLLAFGLGFALSHDALLEWHMLILNSFSERIDQVKLVLQQWRNNPSERSNESDQQSERALLPGATSSDSPLTPFHTYDWSVWPSRVALSALSVLIVSISLGIGLGLHFSDTYLPMNANNAASMRDIGRWISYGIEGGILVLFILRELSHIVTTRYLCNLVRNPLAPFLQTARAVKWTRIGFHLFMCILLCLYYIFFIDRVPIRQNSDNWFAVFTESMLMIRCFRWTWVNTRSAYAELLLVAVLDKIPFGSVWTDFSFAAKLFFFGFAVHRLLSGAFMDRLRFILLMYVTPIQKKKYRFTNWRLVIILNALCVPCILLTLVIGTLFVSPLLPLLGLPLFFVGAPRPLRTWTPTGVSYNECEDTVLYKDMEASILKRLSNLFSGGALMSNVQPGDILMLRSEFFMVWVEVVERGFGYARVVVKGLELQTTSCHAEEATQLDALIDTIFESSKPVRVNKRFLHTFRPVCQTNVESFTLSNISLVGIIDQPDTFDHFYFVLAQCMIWIIEQKLLGAGTEAMPLALDATRFDQLSEFPFESFEIDDAEGKFPDLWYQFVVEGSQSDSKVASDVLAAAPPTLEDHVHFVRVQGNSESDTTASAVVTSVSAFSMDDDEDNDNVSAATRVEDGNLSPQLSVSDGVHHVKPIIEIRTTLNSNQKAPESSSNTHLSRKKQWIKWFVLSTIIALKKSTMGEKLNAFKIYEIYSGESFAFDSFIRRDAVLQEIFMTAFRFATYIKLESKIYGLEEDGTDFDTLKSTLESILTNHSIRSASDHGAARSQSVETFFTLEQEKSSLGNPVYKAKYMKRASIPFYVGKLNAEAVRSIWANLQQELFYFTNDDDERLSIQAMSPLLRNIAISAAEPPLGYPIYSSVSTIMTGAV